MNSWHPRNSPVPNGGMQPLDESAVLAPLQSMDKQKLQKLLDDEDKIRELVQDCPQINQLIEEKKSVEATNKQLAEANVKCEPQLIEEKAQLGKLHKDVQEARNNYNSLKARIDSMSDKNSAGTILALLQAATAEIEDKSEDVANRLLSGSIDADKFLEEFLPLRKLCNERRVKVEKMTELVSRPGGGATGGRGPVPPTSVAPYPGGAGYSMPQPSFGFPTPYGVYNPGSGY